jgi:hypothetical protein
MIDYPRENRFLITILKDSQNFMQLSVHYRKQRQVAFSSRNLKPINHQPIILLNPTHAVPNQVKHKCNPSHTEHTSPINPHITTIPSSIVRNQHGITKPHAQSKIPATTTSNPTCMSIKIHFP